MEDAIEAIAIKSANDIAVAVAEAVAGSEDAFVRRMNAKASVLELRNTTFRNPSGLPDSGQRTTARDMVLLAQRTLEDFPSRRRYFGLPAAKIAGRMVQGHNRLLKRGECAGGKTGYIRRVGLQFARRGRKWTGSLSSALFLAATRLPPGIATWRTCCVTARTVWPEGPLLQIRRLLPPTTRHHGHSPVRTRHKQTRTCPPVMADLTPPPSAGQVLTPPPAATTAPSPRIANARGFRDRFHQRLTTARAVRVGAYRDTTQAQQALARATRALPVILGSAFPRTIPTATMGQLHRAQLIGLDEQGAKAACATLTRQGMQCLTVPPGQAS